MASTEARYSNDQAGFKPGDLELRAILGKVFGLDSENKGRAVINIGVNKSSGESFAVKRFCIDEASEEAMKLIRHEVVSMRQLKHDNILPCLASFAQPTTSLMEVWLISPLMEMGSMRKILDCHFPEGIPEAAISPVMRDVLRAVVHLHERGIVHRSLKCSHILIDNGGRVKLTGLRYSCSLYEHCVEASASAASGCTFQDRYDYPIHVAQKNLNWMSPEILAQNLMGYNEKSDLYSLGVTACEMANGLVPFSEMPGTLMLLEKLRGSAPRLLDSSTFNANVAVQQQQQEMVFSGDKPADSGVGTSMGSCSNLKQSLSKNAKSYANRSFTDAFHDFVDQCCLREADSRPSASALLAHPFIKALKKSSGVTLSLSALLSNQDLAAAVETNTTAGDSLTMDFESKLLVSDVEWVF